MKRTKQRGRHVRSATVLGTIVGGFTGSNVPEPRYLVYDSLIPRYNPKEIISPPLRRPTFHFSHDTIFLEAQLGTTDIHVCHSPCPTTHHLPASRMCTCLISLYAFFPATHSSISFSPPSSLTTAFITTTQLPLPRSAPPPPARPQPIPMTKPNAHLCPPLVPAALLMLPSKKKLSQCEVDSIDTSECPVN